MLLYGVWRESIMYSWITKYIILLNRSKAKIRLIRKANTFDIFNTLYIGILSPFPTLYFIFCSYIFP